MSWSWAFAHDHDSPGECALRGRLSRSDKVDTHIEVFAFCMSAGHCQMFEGGIGYSGPGLTATVKAHQVHGVAAYSLLGAWPAKPQTERAGRELVSRRDRRSRGGR